MELSLDQARRITQVILESVALPGGDEAVIADEPIEFDRGWVFMYDSKHYLETGELSAALAGNAPIAVFRSGEVRILGTAYPLEHYLDQLNSS
jgi:hypothetical protein